MVTNNTSTTVPNISKGKNRGKDWIDNVAMLLMSLPVIIYIFIFSYIPMFGLVIAFKDYRFDKGILGSKWAGFENFIFFFTSQDCWRVTKNTVGLNFLFIVIGLISAVFFALILFEISKKVLIKTYQTIMILPSYLSWVVVGFMTYALLHPQIGLINQFLKLLGSNGVDWYSAPAYWPLILTLAVVWKSIGINTVIYYAGLMGISPDYYEAAAIDGANKWQQTIYISIPFLVPLMTILVILGIGGIFRADFGMFFNLTRDVGALYPTTDVIDTYVFRALKVLNATSMSAAVGLYQSVVGFILIVITNWVVNKIEPENALF